MNASTRLAIHGSGHQEESLEKTRLKHLAHPQRRSQRNLTPQFTGAIRCCGYEYQQPEPLTYRPSSPDLTPEALAYGHGGGYVRIVMREIGSHNVDDQPHFTASSL